MKIILALVIGYNVNYIVFKKKLLNFVSSLFSGIVRIRFFRLLSVELRIWFWLFFVSAHNDFGKKFVIKFYTFENTDEKLILREIVV